MAGVTSVKLAKKGDPVFQQQVFVGTTHTLEQSDDASIKTEATQEQQLISSMKMINPNDKERTAQELNRLELEVRPGIELIEAALYKCYYQNKALTSVYDHEAIKKIIAEWVEEWI